MLSTVHEINFNMKILLSLNTLKTLLWCTEPCLADVLSFRAFILNNLNLNRIKVYFGKIYKQTEQTYLFCLIFSHCVVVKAFLDFHNTESVSVDKSASVKLNKKEKKQTFTSPCLSIQLVLELIMLISAASNDICAGPFIVHS